jgi:hypothetical protein
VRRTFVIISALCALLGLWAAPSTPAAAATPAASPVAGPVVDWPIPPGWVVVTPDDLTGGGLRRGDAPAGALSPAGADAAQAGGYYILSWANLRYVAAELGATGGSYGMLRARSTSIGPWERFSFLSTDHSTFVILANANTRYVSAELGYGGDDYGMLRARAWPAGPWEDFRLLYNAATDSNALQSVANGLYVSAELGATGNRNGMLRARAAAIGPWEQFEVGYSP